MHIIWQKPITSVIFAFFSILSNWANEAADPSKRSLLFFFDIAVITFLITIAIMGYGTYLFVLAILDYCDWLEGTSTNWALEALITFGIPLVYLLGILESLAVIGYFSFH